jgi:signal transduction histidine kinase/ActR/RegA family two-component response regulator
MGWFRALQRQLLASYRDAPIAVQEKCGMLLSVTIALLALLVVDLLVVEMLLRRSPLGVATTAILIAAFGLDLWLLRRGHARVAALLSMLILFTMLAGVGLISVASSPLLVAAKLAVLLGAFIVYTSLVGDQPVQPIAATALSLATVVMAYALRVARAPSGATPFEVGWLINFCWALVFVGIFATLTSLVFRRSMGREEGKARELLQRAEEARQADAKLRRVEERLWRSEKLQAIGQLAGGVAHDFNNELTVILGAADLLEQNAAEPGTRDDARAIKEAAARSAELTRQLLTFARQGAIRSEPIDVHEVVREVVAVLRHTLDRRITVVCELEAPGAMIMGDAVQLHHALLNLSINARDAMPEGGTLSFRTRSLALDPNAVDPETSLAPGAYLQLEVADTGAGMDAATRAHLFEPFFSTKGPGKGTGLGLATVFGTIQSHRGALHCYSEKGEGTVFKILLPLRAEPGQNDRPVADEAVAPASSTRARRRILLVDDEPGVRRIGAAMLNRLGHEVVVAAGGAEAIAQLVVPDRKGFDLIVLDMIMPDMSGREVFEKIRALQPDARVVLASGFSVERQRQALLDAGVRAILQKPYHLTELDAAIERALSD